MNFKESFIIFLKGLCMGTADIIPGVSGGTIALITGIYERLVFGIKRINFNLKKSVDWEFFVPLVLGISCAFLALSRIIKLCLTDFTGLTYAFFFGLILASAGVIYKKVGKLNSKDLLFLGVGFMFAFSFVGLKTLETEHTLLVIFFSGMMAICAMILPGISGAFILLFLNQYEYLLGALNNLVLVEIFTFITGAFLGILAFSRILSYLLKNYETHTFSFLVGLMLGSLRLPLQKILADVSPWALIPALLGVILVFILETKFK